MSKFSNKTVIYLKSLKSFFKTKTSLTYKVYKLEDRTKRLEKTNFALLKQLLEVASDIDDGNSIINSKANKNNEHIAKKLQKYSEIGLSLETKPNLNGDSPKEPTFH